jgi:type IV pilus assembly protein PilQ
MIDSLDIETDQIKISAQLLEVESKALEELGIDWTFLTSSQTGTANYPITHDIQMDQTANRVSDPFGTFTYSTLQTDFTLEGKISALMRDNKARIVAHPEITTVDNKEAVIQMGQKIPVKQFDPSGNVVITFVEVGTILKVTPHITSENRILMKLKPERSSYQFDPNGVIINTNNAETNVVVQNGQTAVIGGLTSQERKETNSGLPILKDIPLIGYLFRYTNKEIVKRDLVIFVTPTIVTKEMKGMSSTFDLPQPKEEKPKE